MNEWALVGLIAVICATFLILLLGFGFLVDVFVYGWPR